MKCSIDQTDRMMTERQGIEIDYCPTCRGVCLDRGELDKLIERCGPAHAPRTERPYRQEASRPPYGEPRYDEPRHNKPKSLLGNLFDF